MNYKGIIEDGFYQEQIPGVPQMAYFSWNKCKYILESPKAFFAHYSKGRKEAPTAAMDTGHLIHLAVLEGKKFREKFVVEPLFEAPTQDGIMSQRSKGAVAQRKAWQEEQAKLGRIIVTNEEFEMLIEVVENVMEHPQALKLLTGGRAEGWGYVWDEAFGRYQLVRADFITNDLRPVEVKTTSKKLLTPKAWLREAFRMGYVGQLAGTSRGVGLLNGTQNYRKGAWIVIQTKQPYDVFVFTADENTLIAGENKAFKAYHLINDYLGMDPEMKNAKLWPGRQQGKAQECVAEPWMLTEDDDYAELAEEET